MAARSSPQVLLVVSSTISLVVTEVASGNINLELRPASSSVFVGNTVSLGLYAVSDSMANQALAGVDVILNWNPAFLSLGLADLTGSSMSGPGFSNLPPDLGGFNSSLSDGDAIWVGYAPLMAPVTATPSGTLLVTFNFLALAPTAPNTPVTIPASDLPNTGGGPGGSTRVFDSEIPNFNVVGSLSGALVTVNVPGPGTWVALAGTGLIGRRGRRRD